MIDKRKIDLIVIGTSAGGVEALNYIFADLSSSANFPPIVVVLHIPLNYQSKFEDVFGTPLLKVVEAEDKAPLQPGHIYFAPPGYHLQIETEHIFSLSNDLPVQFAKPSIDMLFMSAADVYKSRLLGIILTGANRDGAAGLKKIFERGGETWVQNPEEAVYPEMPLAALKLSPKSRMLKLGELREQLKLL